MQIKATGLYRIMMASAAVTAVAVPHAAWAQDATAGNATQLEQLTVQGGQGGGQAMEPVDGYVAKTTGAGSKSATPISEIPQSISVVGREELEDRGVVTKIDEALRYTAGVSTEPFGSDPDTDWFYIRGFDATQTGVFLDGLNLFSFGFGGFQTDAYMLERVEVLKGPASVLYGGANPGGIVNLIRKRPQAEPAYSTEIGINNFGNAFFGFDANDKLNEDGTVTYRVTGKIAGGDNYSDYSEDLRGFIMPQVTFAPDDATSLTLYAMASALDQVHVGNGFLPYAGTVTDGPFGGKIDRDFFFGEPYHDFGRYDQQMIGYEFSHEFDNGWKLSQNLRYAHVDKAEELVYPYAFSSVPGSTDLARLGFKHDTSVDSLSIDTRGEKEFSTGPLDHTLLVGIDYKNFKLDQTQSSAFPASDLDPTDPEYGKPFPTYGSPYIDGVTRMQQVGIYAQDQIRFGDGWLATLNGRYDFINLKGESRLVGGDYDTKDEQLSGRAGLAYEFDNGLTPYVSAATFFNPLAGTRQTDPADPFNPLKVAPLIAEEGEQYEAGIKYEPTFVDGLLTASLFHITKQNALVTSGLIQEQVGEIESRGLEIEGKLNINQNWKILASYAYTDMEITEDANPAFIGNRPYLIPEHQASVWLDYLVTDGPMEGVSVGGGLRYQGESFADMANTATVPDAVVADAAIRYEKNGWGAALNVTNLFDKDYVKGCQGMFTCGYGDQRTITLKLSKSW
ncbi:TonB-dependent siderophore receptor [Rhizobium sp. Root482]|uniref:TonB-dependent siderophore receptor n=1 Tax=Rhizobium sp. Root482 TaxID=1736543 RepID=UPI0006F4ECE8|nr:ferrichrome-iron receptor [Rhizobium sp. Root482]